MNAATRFRPAGTIFKGRRGDCRVVVIQQPPTKRTIVVDGGHRFFLSLPWMIYIIEYRGISVWPFRAVAFNGLKVFVANGPLNGLKDTVSFCPLPMHNMDGTICMGNTLRWGTVRWSLHKMSERVISAYWEGQWIASSVSRELSIDGVYQSKDVPMPISDVTSWKNWSKALPDLVERVDWTRGRYETTLKAAIGNPWIGTFYNGKSLFGGLRGWLRNRKKVS